MAIPQKIGRYEILSKIAGGGMAVVYLARDPRVGRQVAVKVLYEHLAQDPQIRERFKREAETIAALEHPAVVPLYDFGEEDESLYLVMRYMQGGTLVTRMKEGGMAAGEIVPVVQRVGAALTEAHSQNIIHRDLKPGNILFDHTNRAYLSDFGIARLLEATMTATDAMMGTPAYMSPEQVRGPKEVDYRSDIYGLGVILFEMLTGQRPFSGDTPLEQATARILYPPPHLRDFNAALPEGWDWVIQKALARDKTERYQFVAAFVADVEAVADGREPSAPPLPYTGPDATAVTFVLPAEPQLTPTRLVAPEVAPTLTPEMAGLAAADDSVSTPIKPEAGGKITTEKRGWNSRVIATIVGLLLLGVLAIWVFNRGQGTAVPTGTPLAIAVIETETATATITPSPTRTATLTATPSATASDTPTATPSPTQTASATTAVTTTSVPATGIVLGPANVRSGPGTVYAVIAAVRTDDTVTILARDASGEWLNVELADATAGWLASRFVDAATETISLAVTIPPTPRLTNTPTPTITFIATPTPPPSGGGGGGGGGNTPVPTTPPTWTPPPPEPTWTPPPGY